MPTLQVFPENVLEFVDGDGNTEAQFTFNTDSGSVELVEVGGQTLQLSASLPGEFFRSDITTQSITLSPYESAWIDTGAAGGTVTATLPPEGDDLNDGARVEVGVADASNDVDVAANTGQTILGTPTILSTVGETVTLEYNADTSTWMIR
jgi:hypothetical protein